MQPSWRRLVGSTVVLFVVILAFLVGRVRAGTDPGLVREASQPRSQQSAPPLASPGSVPARTRPTRNARMTTNSTTVLPTSRRHEGCIQPPDPGSLDMRSLCARRL